MLKKKKEVAIPRSVLATQVALKRR
jgi:hypothetical protein